MSRADRLLVNEFQALPLNEQPFDWPEHNRQIDEALALHRNLARIDADLAEARQSCTRDLLSMFEEIGRAL